MEEFVGTALVLAYLQASSLMPVVELARRCAAASRFFAGMNTPAGRSFDVTRTDFVTMMSPGILDIRHKWLLRARLWKLLLSQHATEGYWDASTTTAFALEAREPSETAGLKPTLLQRITALVSNVTEELEDRHGNANEAVIQAWRDEEDDEHDASGEAHATPRSPRAAISRDDPLSCSPIAIVASMPPKLAAVKKADPTVDVVRVWTTMCCVSHLQRLNVSWIWGSGDIYAERERTVVDAGREWVERYATERPALQAALADGAVRMAAKRVTRLWRRACELRVAELRRSPAVRSQLFTSHVHRSANEIVRALVMKHSTFSTFLSEPLGGLQRWQSTFHVS
jgi:hypothetical protein